MILSVRCSVKSQLKFVLKKDYFRLLGEHGFLISTPRIDLDSENLEPLLKVLSCYEEHTSRE